MTDTARLEANKKLVTDMWHEFIDAHDVAAAPRFIAPGYVQHNPNALPGLAGVMKFHEDLWPEGPRAPGTYEKSKFVAVLAEGDFVQLVLRWNLPDKDNPGRTYARYWFDLYRVEDGMIVEHWDPAAKGEAPF